MICAGCLTIPEEIFLISAKCLTEMVTEQDYAVGKVYPPLDTITNCSVKIAAQIMDYAYQNGLAPFMPEPKNKEKCIRSQLYKLDYPNVFPELYDIEH